MLLLEHTSHIQQHRQLQMLEGVRPELMELYQVQEASRWRRDEDDGLSSSHLSRTNTSAPSSASKVFAELVKTIPTSVMKRLTSIPAPAPLAGSIGSPMPHWATSGTP